MEALAAQLAMQEVMENLPTRELTVQEALRCPRRQATN
jgi:hypothetical protein